MIVPVFPLSGVFLFPSAILPLHIFEPRYRQMVEGLLDSAGRFVIATMMEPLDDDPMGSPSFYPVAGLGEISGHEKLDDGRFFIALFGMKRVRVREVESDQPYRMVSIEDFGEVAVPEPRSDGIRDELVSVVSQTAGDRELVIPPDAPVSALIDLVLMQTDCGVPELSALYSEPDIERRGRQALAALKRHGPRAQSPRENGAEREGDHN